MASTDNDFASSSTATFSERQPAAGLSPLPHQISHLMPPSNAPCLTNQSSISIQLTLSNQSQPAMSVSESSSDPSPMELSSSQSIPIVAFNLSVLGHRQLASSRASNSMSNVSNSTALELLVPNHPFGDLAPCHHGGHCSRESAVACNACLLQGIQNPCFPLIPLDRLPSRNPGGRRGLPLILDEKLSILYRCLRHEQTYCKLQRDKDFNKSTVSRIVNDPKVKRWLARVLVVYPKGESFYRWLRIILHPCTMPNDPRMSKETKPIDGLHENWRDSISPNMTFEHLESTSPGLTLDFVFPDWPNENSDSILPDWTDENSDIILPSWTFENWD
ncbi:MAG: hypothetical protein J3Q66DRAFT_385163 [Benniella sp.]|nr:MAG: hypothetical protein J3Q66DRAFT_385163 [Benniella sp.]